MAKVTKADRVAKMYAAMVGIDPKFVGVGYSEICLKRHPREVIGVSASTGFRMGGLPEGCDEPETFHGAVCKTRSAALESLRRAVEKEAFSRYVRLRKLFGLGGRRP